MSNNQMWDSERWWGNTKRSAWILLLAIAAVCIGFAFYRIPPLDELTDYESGRYVGRAFSYFLMSGFIPLIWWGIRRFRYDRSYGPLVVWLILAIVLSYVSDQGQLLGEAVERGQSPFGRR